MHPLEHVIYFTRGLFLVPFGVHPVIFLVRYFFVIYTRGLSLVPIWCPTCRRVLVPFKSLVHFGVQPVVESSFLLNLEVTFRVLLLLMHATPSQI